MKLSALFLLIVLPGYFVCAEPIFGGFLGNLFNSASSTVGSGLGLFGGIVSSVVDGVKTATKGIIQTVFGNGHFQSAEPNAAVTAPVDQNSPCKDVSKPDGNVAEIVTTPSTVAATVSTVASSDSSVTEPVSVGDTTPSTETIATEKSSGGE